MSQIILVAFLVAFGGCVISPDGPRLRRCEALIRECDRAMRLGADAMDGCRQHMEDAHPALRDTREDM